MESTVHCRNAHTGRRQGEGSGPIVPYCASPVPCTGPVHYDYTIRATFRDNKPIDMGTEVKIVTRKSSISCVKDLVQFGQLLI